MHASDVGAPNACRQAVRGAIGDAQGVGFVVEGNHGQHRSEDFLLRNPHVVFDVREHRGFDVVAAVTQTRTPGHGRCAFRLADLDVVQHRLHLPQRYQRTHRSARCARIAHADGPRALRQALHHLVIYRPLDQHSRAGGAHLPGIEENARGGGTRGAIQIGICKDHVCGLSAQLEGHLLEVAGGALQNSAPDSGRTGEGHFVDAGMPHQRLADDAALAAYHVERARRQSRFEKQLGDPQHGKWRQFRRFDHQRATAGQRRRNFPHADHEREIPGHDGRDDAHRLAHGVRQGIRPRRYHLPRNLVAPTGVVAHGVDDRGHILAPHGRQRFAGIQAFQFDEFFLVLLEKHRRALQNAAALSRPHPAPNIQRRARRVHGEIHLDRSGLSHFGNRLLGGGIQIDGILAAAGRNVPAVDE
jgi:hypothetical protein